MRGWCLGFLGASLAMVPLVLGAFTNPLDLGPFDFLDGRDHDADLVVAPGTRGFLDTLRTGPQIHSYDEAADRTTILDEVWLGRRSVRFPVARYEGRPSRDVTPGRLRRLEAPHSFLFFRYERGGPYGEGLVVAPGTFTVEAEDGSRHEVALAPGEIVWCTVSPLGVAIDETSAP